MIEIQSPGKIIRGSVQVPFSKSESNRALIISALCDAKCEIKNLSDADDTKILQQLLTSQANTLDAEAAGTTARFLIAYCALKQKEVVITGNDRLRKRPVKGLVEALTQLGANIQFQRANGFLPVKIFPALLSKTHVIEVDATESSQHVSALLMIAPLLKNGLVISLKGEKNSEPYIRLTAKVMKEFGVNVKMEENKITIAPQPYKPTQYSCSGDWSAAAFWFELAAICDEAEIEIANLQQNGLQGDEEIIEIVKPFGIETVTSKNGIILKKIKKDLPEYFTYDFRNHPDLALPVAAVCGAHAVQSDLYGLKNLVIKESDRVSAFQREAYKLNIKTDFCDCSKLKIFNYSSISPHSKEIKTYNDHRLAMTFAPLSVLTGKIKIDSPQIVSKSYPDFWGNLEKLGFKISP